MITTGDRQRILFFRPEDGLGHTTINATKFWFIPD
jgi:hypothetical protein